jgi:hypothetical protein
MERTKNALLFVIALCLVLIVLRLYSSGEFVSVAEAQGPGQQTNLYGCRGVLAGGECASWVPVQVNRDGKLITASD